MQAVDWSGNAIGSVGNAREQLVEDLGGSGPSLQSLEWPGYGGVLELSQVCCRLVGFNRVASKVTCLPIKPDRVQKYLGGMHYQYSEFISGPGGSTTVVHCLPITCQPHKHNTHVN